jgi:NAD(P)-dependent dehydrogenase (short-subunit alcohol dehydrogenase family)
MLYSVQDKVAIITGASSGFGLNLAKRLVANKAWVVLGDVDDMKGRELAQELNSKASRTVAIYRHCDVTKKDDQLTLFRAGLEAFGRIDIMICNAGIGERNQFTSDETDDWTKVPFATHLGR